MILRPSAERGHADHEWLNTYHTFSFADYYDPSHTGFGTLRVINEDRIKGGTGFDTHPHHDMEIVSYIVSGGIEHQDSIGNKGVILPQEVQIMSAGTGVEHSERNHFKNQETHFFQIWILPDKKGIAPRYEQKSLKDQFNKQKLTLVVSKDERDGSLLINQDVDIYIARLKMQEEINFNIRSGRHVWLQLIKGNIQINGIDVKSGDGLAVSNEKTLPILSKADS
ncbi:MAG: pirin family protein, partial [Candidatus Omnitrophica bacterium]|nr:pirin family protein [Candidatus Omnitrophota bacterium]